MAYEPKHRKLKVRWKFAGPFLILVALFMYMLVNLVMEAVDDTPPKFTICDFSEKKTESILSKKYKDPYELSEYLFYGESLNLLKNPYNPEVNDEVVGKTIVLKNLCTGKDYPFAIEGSIDRHIALGEITPGYYEVYVIDNLKQRRITFNRELKDASFTTIEREGKVNQVSLIVDKNILKDYDKKDLPNNLFIEVKQKNPKKTDVDVIIDPSAFNNDFGPTLDRGVQANGLEEYQESFKAATRLKEKLERYGLRVQLTRSNVDDIVNTYGENGRLARGYQSNARYYVHLGMNKSEYDSILGMEIYHSAHSSPTFANALMYDLKKNTKITGNVSNAQDLNNAGVNRAFLIEGKDGRIVYDNDMFIRESGGKATMAAQFSENSESGNASFAKDNIHGMQSVSLYYSYFTNKQDAAFWKDNWESIVDETAKSIAKYLNVKLIEK